MAILKDNIDLFKVCPSIEYFHIFTVLSKCWENGKFKWPGMDSFSDG